MPDDLTVILADGDFPRSEHALAVLGAAKRIVCCDGAADTLTASGRVPDRIVGDLDSLSEELRDRYSDRLVCESGQEDNDLTKAFRYCRAQGWNRLAILGATGKREDHTLGNLSLLTGYAREVPDIRMITDSGEFFTAGASGRFPSRPGEQISIFAPHPDTVVHASRGLKFPMRGLRLEHWWQASLNEAEGDSFELDFTPGRQLLIFRTFDTKKTHFLSGGD